MDLPDGLIPKLFAHLTPKVVKVGVDHLRHDMSAAEIAALRGIPQRTVERSIAKLYAVLKQLGIPRPARPPRADTRHVRNISPEMMRAI